MRKGAEEDSRPTTIHFDICGVNSILLIQESVDIAGAWTNNNDMNINSEKSKEIVISYAHSGDLSNEVPITLPIIILEGNVVE